MLITNSNIAGDRRLRIRNRVIEQTDQIKFLGIMLDHKISLKNHISYITTKLSRSIGAINRISYFIPFTQLLNLYYSLVYTHLTYGVVVWGKSNIGGMEKMQRMQKRAIKTITKYDSNDRPELSCLMNFESIYSYCVLAKLFKILRENKHEYFYDRLMNIQVNHNHFTRFKAQLSLNAPLFDKSRCLASFVYQSVNNWNRLPLQVKKQTTMNSFKTELKQFLLANQTSIT